MKVLETETHWIIKCRACDRHYIPKTKRPNRSWSFNGDVKSPTFTPSINECCNPTDHPEYRPDVKSSRCHFIIADGQIRYCGDCTHELVDQIVPLDDFTDVEMKLHQSGLNDL